MYAFFHSLWWYFFKPVIEVVKLNHDSGGVVPTKGTGGSAGYDLYNPEYVSIGGGEIKSINLCIGLSIPPGYVGIIKDRSSLALRGLHVLGGVIDSDYRLLKRRA